MQRRAIILIWIFLFSFCPPFSFFPTPAQAVSFTANDYWFFINETGVIDYEEMSFSVLNGQDTPIEIVCSYQQIEGVEFEVIFDWRNTTILAHQKAVNHYKINITSTLYITFILEIYVRQKPLGTPDSQLTGGGVVINKITFYSEEEGSILNLRVVDQSDAYREALVSIKYKVNHSFSFSPIQEFNGSRFYGALPVGHYLVQAQDRETGIYGEKIFELTHQNQTNIDVVLTLVGFGRFKLESRGVLGVNATINNFVGDLQNLRIYAVLIYETKEIMQTPEISFSYFPKTDNFELMLWFDPIKWKEGKYIVKGVIEASGVIIASKSVFFSFNLDSPPDSYLQVYFIVVILIVLAVSINMVRLIRRKYHQKQLTQNEGMMK